MAKKSITRADGTLLSAYAPGDGDLSFVASYNGRATSCSTITESEALELCPNGWTIYRDGPYFRARLES